MSLSRLAPSRSKTDFLRHLGLDDNDPQTNDLYLEMMNESAVAWQRIVNDSNNLVPRARDTTPPYSSNQIRESAIHREVMNVYRDASPGTRPYYERGRHGYGSCGSQEDNWIIRWCLWHVFRYRDERNRTYRARHPEFLRRNRSPCYTNGLVCEETRYVPLMQHNDPEDIEQDQNIQRIDYIVEQTSVIRTPSTDTVEISPSQSYYDPIRDV